MATKKDRSTVVRVAAAAFEENKHIVHLLGAETSPRWLRMLRLKLLFRLAFDECMANGFVLMTKDGQGIAACSTKMAEKSSNGKISDDLRHLPALFLLSMVVSPSSLQRLEKAENTPYPEMPEKYGKLEVLAV